MSTQVSSQIISEEWLTIQEISRLFFVSEKQVRRTIKKFLMKNSPAVRQEEIEGKLKLPNGNLINAYILLMTTKKVYELWETRERISGIIEQIEKETGKRIQTMPIMPTPHEEEKEKMNTLLKEEKEKVSTSINQENKIDYPEWISFLKEMIRSKDKQINDYSKKVDDFLERYKEVNILLRDLQSKVFLIEQGKQKESEEAEVKEETKTNNQADPLKEETAPQEETKEETQEETKEEVVKDNVKEKTEEKVEEENKEETINL